MKEAQRLDDIEDIGLLERGMVVKLGSQTYAVVCSLNPDKLELCLKQDSHAVASSYVFPRKELKVADGRLDIQGVLHERRDYPKVRNPQGYLEIRELVRNAGL